MPINLPYYPLAPLNERSTLKGTIEQMNRLLNEEIKDFQSGDQIYKCIESDISLPEQLADVVIGIFGLDQRPLLHRK